jgi:cell pole-organizing protein PopZ
VAAAALVVPAGAVAGATTTPTTAAAGSHALTHTEQHLDCSTAQWRLDYRSRLSARQAKHLAEAQARLNRLQAKVAKDGSTAKGASRAQAAETRVQATIARIESHINHTLSGKALAQVKRYEAAAAQVCHLAPSTTPTTAG